MLIWPRPEPSGLHEVLELEGRLAEEAPGPLVLERQQVPLDRPDAGR